MEWTCSQCEKSQIKDISDYTQKIFRLRHLKQAGYPFRANDLTIEEWEDLGRVSEMMNERARDKDHAGK